MSLKKEANESKAVMGCTLSVSSVVDLSPDQPEQHGPDSVERAEDSNTSTRNSSEKLLTSLLFAIPLPNPAKDYLSANNAVRPILLYTLPRAVYEKPPKDPQTGKRPREKISKKIARSWNKSIQDGEDIKRGDFPSPSITKKCLGAIFRWTAFSLRFITACDNQMLSRLPPTKKLGQVQIVCLGDPCCPIDSDQKHESQNPVSPEKAVEEILIDQISQVKKQTKIRIILSGIILPMALVAEIFVPLVFEICLLYFLVQYRGWRKVQILLKKYEMENNSAPSSGNDLESGNSEIKESTSCTFEFQVIKPEICQEINKLTYSACSQVDSHKFPDPQDLTINSRVLIHQKEVIEITPSSTLPFESDSKGIIDSELKKDLPVLDIKSNIVEPIPETKDSIAIELNEKNRETSERAQSVDENEQETVMNEGVARNELHQGALADVPSTENDTNSVIKSTHTLPSSNDQNHNELKPVPNIEIAASLIEIFKASLPPNIVTRHELNERRVAEDFNRVLKRRTSEYVKSIKKIS